MDGREIIKGVQSALFDLHPDDEAGFNALAREVYRYQTAHNPVYSRYCKEKPFAHWTSVPYLPVAAFKQAPITAFPTESAERIFRSSGTGRTTPSKHYVRDLSLYERAVTTHFEAVVGSGPFTLVAHLPHYAERGKQSSLVHMVQTLIDCYGDDHSGFFLTDRSLLDAAIAHTRRASNDLILFGAAFGLLDLVDEKALQLPEDALVIETGGMKTYRQSITRDALHDRLSAGLSVPESRIWSEYGMCELMSQCYTRGDHVFRPPPWMRARVVDPDAPTETRPAGQPGALTVFDLANLHSVSALFTEDRAVQTEEGFRVLGRLDEAELRGCNFLVESAR